jgi:hypothetical protein
MGTEYCSHANKLDQDIFTLTDNLTWYKGNHVVTFGTHNEFYKMYNVYAQNATGNWSFNSLEDFRNNKANSFSYTYFNTTDLDEDGNWGGKFGAAQFGLYVQDEWCANDNFTLTYGVRADIPVMLDKPTANEEFNNSDLAKEYDVRTGDVPSGKVLFSPRVGFRWYADKKHNVLLRGGAGLFTGRVPFVWISNNFSNNGMEQVSVKSYDQDMNPTLGQNVTGEDVKNMGFKASSSTINVVDKTYGAIILENVTGELNGDAIVIDNDNNSVMVLQNCNLTLAEGKKLIKSVRNTIYQVFMQNITINGVKLNQESAAQYLENVGWYQVVADGL